MKGERDGTLIFFFIPASVVPAFPKTIVKENFVIERQSWNRVIAIDESHFIPFSALIYHIFPKLIVPNPRLPKRVDPFQSLQEPSLLVYNQHSHKQYGQCPTQTVPCHYKFCSLIVVQCPSAFV